jgi:hypothetical protein
MRILDLGEEDAVYRDTQKRLPLTPGVRYLVSSAVGRADEDGVCRNIIDGVYQGPDDELSVAMGGYYLLFSDNQKIWSRNILHFVDATPPLCLALAVKRAFGPVSCVPRQPPPAPVTIKEVKDPVLLELIDLVLTEETKAVADYMAGKETAISYLIGKVRKSQLIPITCAATSIKLTLEEKIKKLSPPPGP